MKEISLEALLEAGCHFGHQVTRHNPKSRDFVFEARDNIHIIDLTRTKEELETAARFVQTLAARPGSTMILIGAKRQARPVVDAQIKRINESGVDGIFYVTNRWIGGTLTNFSEVSKNYKKLKDLTAKLNDPDERSHYTKKEIGQWMKEKIKLESFYGGTFQMTKIPDAIYIIDTHLEDLAVKEAARMNVKTVGMVDTNADPSVISYPIPANDDAVGSIELITTYIVDAWIEGRKEGVKAAEKAKEKQEASEKKAEEALKKTEEPAKKENKEKKVKAEKAPSVEEPKKRGRKKKTEETVA